MDASRIRVDDSDQRNQVMEAASSEGRDTMCAISRERVVRILSFEERMVAMNAPSGLGRHCVDAEMAEISIGKVLFSLLKTYT